MTASPNGVLVASSGKLTAKDIWQEQNRRRAQADKDRKDAAAAAHRAALSQYKEQKASLDAELSAIEQARADAERRKLTKPKRVLVGATTNNPNPIFVWHWLVEPPKDMSVAMRRKGMGLLLALLPGGGELQERNAALGSIRRAHPTVDSDYPAFIEAHRKALTESYERYGKLFAQLRDDELMAKLFEDADVCLVDKDTKEVQGQFGMYKRDVSTIDVPTLIGVDIEPDGLVLTYENRSRDSAKRWSAAQRIDLIKNVFRKLGVNANNLRITDDPDTADIRLEFNDAPSSFPTAVAPEPVTVVSTEAEAIAAYPSLRWRFGVDARGNEISAVIAKNPHIALVAQTGYGKSVLSASLIEMLRPYSSCWLFDGKGSDHPAALAELSNVSWISKTAPEHIVGMHWLWQEMNERYIEADQRKAAGQAGRAFDFPPIFVLLDELPSMRGLVDQQSTGALDQFDFWINDLLQKGRQARIHLCLISQSLRVDAVPGWWQENISQIIFLGPVSSRSLQSDAIPESAREVVAELTARIPDSAKGRGVYMSRGEGGVKPIQFQSYYGWAPGTTSMDMAPNAVVREVWERAKVASESVPRLYDRIGIRVQDSDWRKLPVKELMELPTVVVANEHGQIHNMDKYDPLSREFLGRVQVNVSSKRARGRGSGVTAQPAPAPAPAQADTTDDAPGEASTRSSDGDTEYTADSLREVLVEAAARARAEAARRGLVLPSDVDDDDDGDL